MAFEKNLENSKVDYTVIRPTAFFKSLSGQIKRIKQNKKFIVFDNGKKTKSKPQIISVGNLIEEKNHQLAYKNIIYFIQKIKNQ